MGDETFTGHCPTCGQAHLTADVERLKRERDEALNERDRAMTKHGELLDALRPFAECEPLLSPSDSDEHEMGNWPIAAGHIRKARALVAKYGG